MERGSILRCLATLKFFDVFCSLVLIIWKASLIRGYDSLSWSVYCKSSEEQLEVNSDVKINKQKIHNKTQLFETKVLIAFKLPLFLLLNTRILPGGCIIIGLSSTNWKPPKCKSRWRKKGSVKWSIYTSLYMDDFFS